MYKNIFYLKSCIKRYQIEFSITFKIPQKCICSIVSTFAQIKILFSLFYTGIMSNTNMDTQYFIPLSLHKPFHIDWTIKVLVLCLKIQMALGKFERKVIMDDKV